MPESKGNNGWGIYAIRKIVEYVGVGIALWQFGVPAVNDHIESQIKEYELDNKKVPLRTLLSDETGIPKDRFHIVFGKWWKDHLEFEKTINSVLPLLKEEVNTTRPRLVIFDTGRAKWYHTDGDIYDASIGQDGHYWFYLNGKWLPCHT